MRGCHYCGPTEAELRPYGLRGALVCFGCAFDSDDRREQTENAYNAVLDAAIAMSPYEAAVIGDGTDGPQPFTGRPSPETGIRTIISTE